MAAKTWDEIYGDKAEDKPVSSWIANLSEEQLCSIAIEKLSQAIQTIDATKAPDLAVRLSNAVLDRIKGKPAQSITSTVNTTMSMLISNVKTDDALIARIKADLIAGTYGDCVLDNSADDNKI
jgi:hypothetical protein